MQKLVAAELSGAVLTVRLQRTDKRNALSRELLAQLKARFLEWAERDEVRVAVLIGEGDRAFASGGDLKELMALRAEDEARKFAEETHAVLDSVRHFPVPVIAALNGDALGGGAELALACDLRVAAPHARIGFLQSKLAISTAWGGGRDLMHLVGTAQALELLCGAEILNAQQALAAKLISSVTAAGEIFEDQIAARAARLARPPRQVMRAFKSLAAAYRDGAGRDRLTSLERDHFARTWVHDDHWAAVDAAFAAR